MHNNLYMTPFPSPESSLDPSLMSGAKSAASKCPFLKQNQMLEAVTEASEGLRDDIIHIGKTAKKTEKKKG